MEEARAFQPDLVFLDLDLPEMGGYEVARRLRLEPAMKGVTMVAMTGYGQEEDRQRTQEAGFHLHLVKPIDFDRLEELLSLPADQIGRRAQSHTDPDSAERQSDSEADYMKRSVVAQDVITKFQSQSFTANTDMQSRASFRSGSRRDEDIPLPAALSVLRGGGERQQDCQENHENQF